MTEPVVAAKALSKRFGHKLVLNDISVDAAPGDIVGVLGKNGAGKTTLLELLLGFGLPSHGNAELFGHASLELSDRDKSRIGYVPQRDELVEILTGRQQLKLISSFRERWDTALAERLISEWEIPLTTRIAKMSIGERQKLSVLQALAHHPELLILDEPVASLDPIARRQFLRQLLDIAEMTHRCVIFSSHIVSDLERAADRIWILKDGRLVWHGALDALKDGVVRVHFRHGREHQVPTNLPGLLSRRVDGTSAVLAIADWSDEREAAFRSQAPGDFEVERLSLEDIFVELHG